MLIFNDFNRHKVSLNEGAISFSGYEDTRLSIMLVNGTGLPEYGITFGNYVICDANVVPKAGDIIVAPQKEAPYSRLVVMQTGDEDYLSKVIMTGRLLD
ncbi:hypothetical protein [Konateibacter massiliensis]|uniref:hypothetical protein n=1 Tax=Konateibacter massiliensis TaxID=2002841 RepID=UPI000C14E1BE|nr:hypothetical protein [Konateibacter massiliensis]